nr:MAG TPA: hypothetical protein [Bacteriophage sp.]
MYNRKEEYIMMNGIVWETNHSGKLHGMKSIGTCFV